MTRSTRWMAMAYLAAVMVTSGALAQSESHGSGFTDHGVAVAVSRSRGAVVVQDGEGDAKLAVWMQDHSGCYGIAMIDPGTGETTFHDLPFKTADSPFAFLLSRDGVYYSLFGYHFVAFDPAQGEFTDVVKTDGHLAMWMTEDDRGHVWSGSYPGSHLSSYDPATGTLTEHGPINRETWPQYPRAMAIGADGWVYVGIGSTDAILIGFDPQTNEAKPLVDEAVRETGNPVVWRGDDGHVYAKMPGETNPWLRLHHGQATELEGQPDVSPVHEISGHQGMIFGELPDGRTVETVQVSQRRMNVVDAQGQTRQVMFDYPSDGAMIYSLTAGPDGRIYGSTGHPLHFFSYDPQADNFWDISLDMGGHVNTLTTLNDRIYGGIYVRGILIEYEPGREGTADAPNPRRLAQGGATLLRPHAMMTLSDERHLIMTGTPGYGRTGGGMMVYDLDTESASLYEHTELIEHHSTKALAELPDGNLVGGTSTAPGTGGQRIAEQAELYIMQWPSREILYRAPILPGVQEIRELHVRDDGQVCGLASDGTFFIFDPDTRELVHSEAIAEPYGGMTGGQAPRVWALGGDGSLYTLFRRAIVAIDPRTGEHRKLADTPTDVRIGVALHDGRLYFASGSRLWSYAIPVK